MLPGTAPNPSYFFSAAFDQSSCLPNEADDEFLDEMIQIQYEVNKHKNTGLGPKGAEVFNP